MGNRKQSKFTRNDKDHYPTIDPACMVKPFVDSIRGKTYAEPCYGDGDLEDMLMEAAICKWRSDIRPTVKSSLVKDATTLNTDDLKDCDLVITNPPYQWRMLKPLLEHLPTLKPTWLLLPGDYMFNKRMGPYMEKCDTVIAIGRMYWLPNKVRGVSNMAWYKFSKWNVGGTQFVGRGDD